MVQFPNPAIPPLSSVTVQQRPPSLSQTSSTQQVSTQQRPPTLKQPLPKSVQAPQQKTEAQKIIDKARGSSNSKEVKNPDGSITITYGLRKELERDSDGNEKIKLLPDDKVIIKPDGSVTYIDLQPRDTNAHPQRRKYETYDKTIITYNSDGFKTSKKTFVLEGRNNNIKPAITETFDTTGRVTSKIDKASKRADTRERREAQREIAKQEFDFTDEQVKAFTPQELKSLEKSSQQAKQIESRLQSEQKLKTFRGSQPTNKIGVFGKTFTSPRGIALNLEGIKDTRVKTQTGKLTTAQKVLGLSLTFENLDSDTPFKKLVGERLFEEQKKIDKPTKEEISLLGGRINIGGEIKPLITPIVALSQIEERKVKESIFMDLDVARNIRTDLILKETQQTSPQQDIIFAPINKPELPTVFGAKIDDAVPFKGLTTFEEVQKRFTGRDIRKAVESKNPLTIIDSGLKSLQDIGFAKERDTTGVSLTSLGLITLGTATRTAFQTSPLGLGQSLLSRGVVGTFQAYNPANIVRAINEGRFLRSKTELGKIAEFTGIISGVGIGSKTTQSSGKFVVRKVKELGRIRKVQKAVAQNKKVIKSDFGDKIEVVDVDPITGRIVTRRIKQPSRPVIEQSTGAVLQQRQTQLKAGGSDFLKPFEKKGSSATSPEILTAFKKVKRGKIDTLVPKEVARISREFKPVTQKKLIETAIVEKTKLTELGNPVVVQRIKVSEVQFGKPITQTEFLAKFEVPKSLPIRLLEQSKRGKLIFSDPTLLGSSATLISQQIAQRQSIKSTIRIPEIKRLSIPTKRNVLITDPARLTILPPISFEDTTTDLFVDTRTGLDVGFKQQLEVKQDKVLISPLVDLNVTSKFNQFEDTSSSFDLDSSRISGQDVATEQASEKGTIIAPIFNPPSSVGKQTGIGLDLKEPTPITEKKIPTLPKFDFEDKQKAGKLQEVYDVKVKEKGKFKKVNTSPLPVNKSKNLGADFVDNTPSATFKLKKVGERTVEDDRGFSLKAKFRKKGNDYIEINKHRIDSVGELQGITLKAHRQRRRLAF